MSAKLQRLYSDKRKLAWGEILIRRRGFSPAYILRNLRFSAMVNVGTRGEIVIIGNRGKKEEAPADAILDEGRKASQSKFRLFFWTFRKF